MSLAQHYDVIVIGAGAAGLMCAMTAAQRGRRVVVLDHANKVGKKILMSGGGRCNFTNLYASHENYISSNPHFCKSALNRYTPYNFLNLVEKHKIKYVDKDEGQLFCENKAKDILHMLLTECADNKVKIKTRCTIVEIKKNNQFELKTSDGKFIASSLVIASGGLSIPTLGATGFGYEIAKQFGLKVLAHRAALVPFTLQKPLLEKLNSLSGLSVDVSLSCNDVTIRDAMLFTHRGLSGPAVLQISSYWKPGDSVEINLLPELDVDAFLTAMKQQHPKMELKNVLAEKMPKRLAQTLCQLWNVDAPVNQLSDKVLSTLVEKLTHWQIKPSGTEGYRTAEVTLGGVDTDELSSKTMEARKLPGLYFIGEVVDVTGQLGGYNFQWAWSSGWAAGQSV
ncbi:MAG: NAD(P)/FAD-dependent oxidoreductase [Gammaproteobacteria bacterium]|nr:NAD(P)/FAD-dependent oxidoreductase [Gammaproteobacteria bacterium]